MSDFKLKRSDIKLEAMSATILSALIRSESARRVMSDYDMCKRAVDLANQLRTHILTTEALIEKRSGGEVPGREVLNLD